MLSTINFRIHVSNKRFFDRLYEGSRTESSIYVVKITLQILYSVNIGSITGNILQILTKI